MDHIHDDSCTPETCFRAKMRHMRARGGPFVTPKMGNGVSFWDTTIREQQDQMVADAAANGAEIRPKHPVYDKPTKKAKMTDNERRRAVTKAFDAAAKELGVPA